MITKISFFVMLWILQLTHAASNLKGTQLHGDSASAKLTARYKAPDDMNLKEEMSVIQRSQTHHAWGCPFTST